jgi:cystathionine gamma-synthase
MQDLLTDPLWRPEDLGRAIPDSRHAVSVCLPTWQSVIGYEEGDEAVTDQMKCGYPRFFLHPDVVALHEKIAAKKNAGAEGELLRWMAFPHEDCAQRCAAYIGKKVNCQIVVEAFDFGSWVVGVEEVGYQDAVHYWRITGDGVSSRRAESILNGIEPIGGLHDSTDLDKLRQQLAGLYDQSLENVFVFRSGMSAIFAVHRALGQMYPQRRSIQLEFPYVDALKVQQEFGAGTSFVPMTESGGLHKVADILEQEAVAGIYTELPSNPLLRTADIAGVAEILRQAGDRGGPLIVDDTVATVFNVDALRYADVVTCSLTKFFSGVGDVMAGAVVLRGDSPFTEQLRELLLAEWTLFLLPEDAEVLVKNAADFEQRMPQLNANAERLFEYLRARPEVERVWYPATETPQHYENVMRKGREGVGHSTLISLLLRSPEEYSEKFYDALRVNKGPSLGTNFTLACPYVLLAHYEELEWAAECGVDQHLIRISVGLEDWQDLQARFDEAFAVIA